jgi:hypothetical protein
VLELSETVDSVEDEEAVEDAGLELEITELEVTELEGTELEVTELELELAAEQTPAAAGCNPKWKLYWNMQRVSSINWMP